MPMQGSELDGFMRTVLARLQGVSVTSWTLAFMVEWARWEGTEARNNPLATTRTLNRGETIFNSHGVKNYQTIADGIEGTVQTINLHYYTAVLASLQTGRIVNRDLVATQLLTWGTVGFSNLIRNGWNPLPNIPAPTPEAENWRAEIATLRDELARLNMGVHRRFDWIAYGASQAEQDQFPNEAPPRA